MQLDITPNSLPVYEALASNVRLQILQLISERDYNITELSESLGLSKAIITKHIQKLEETRLIRSTLLFPQRSTVPFLNILPRFRWDITPILK